jgi:hypothetical protein
VTFWAIVWVTF